MGSNTYGQLCLGHNDDILTTKININFTGIFKIVYGYANTLIMVREHNQIVVYGCGSSTELPTINDNLNYFTKLDIPNVMAYNFAAHIITIDIIYRISIKIILF